VRPKRLGKPIRARIELCVRQLAGAATERDVVAPRRGVAAQDVGDVQVQIDR
jgi:hypothetical protein